MPNYYPRLILEAIEINKKGNNLKPEVVEKKISYTTQKPLIKFFIVVGVNVQNWKEFQ